MIEIVFFDVGETLLHAHPSFPELFASTCVEHGYRVTPDDVHRVQARLAPRLSDIAEEELDTGDRPYEGSSFSSKESEIFWTALYRRFLRELGIADEDMAAALFRVFSSASSYALFDDVHGVLDELEAGGHRLGVISNFEDWLEEMLVDLEVSHRFDVRVISGVVGVEKPDPQIYRLALDRAGVAPEKALHVGDSPEMDVVPASSVGMNVVLLDRLGRYSQADWPTISSLGELPALLATM
jgi:REG-2-like HAD superfamily hydrolase